MSRSKSLWRSLAAFGASALLACGAFAQSIGWHQIGGGATDIAAGADGSVWVIGNDAQAGGNYGIYRYTGSTWARMPGAAVRIAVDPQGKAWVINAQHQIFHWNGSNWDTNPGQGLDIGVGASGDVWLIGTDHSIWKWDPVASWQKKVGAADRIAVDPKGVPWVVNSAHQIFYSATNGASFVNVPGGALDIGVGSEGSVWIVGTDGSVWKFNGSGWSKADGNLTNITVDNHGNPWGVNTSRQIWASASGAQFATLPAAGSKGTFLVTGGTLSTGQYLVSDNKAFFVIQQSDGNLCTYKGSGPSDNHGGLWCHNKVGAGGQFYTVMQGDGNLCTYSGTGLGDQRATDWCTMALGAGGQFVMVQQGDGNLCVYKGTSPTDNRGYVWCSGAKVPITYGAGPQLSPNGQPTSWKGGVTPGANYPANMPCPTDVYTVPPGVNYVRITATGGTGRDGEKQNVISNLGLVGGEASGHGDSGGAASPGFADVNPGHGGRGATVTGTFPVTPGQHLYVVTGVNGSDSYQNSGEWSLVGGFPGGGAGQTAGAGFSMVALQQPQRTLPNDPNYCFVPPSTILVIAGGGGGGGMAGGAGGGGSGGDAGLVGQPAGSGTAGGGALSGGGGGGGTQSAGGFVGSHPGCGSEGRYAGSYLRGSDNDGAGGSGGGGYYGGGAGGGGDCVLETGNGAGGGGSSYAAPSATAVTSAIDTHMNPSVVIQPMK
ncbi:MAG TPA: tectonin domain-containing protein [Usitatibacter sp.]|nr:tectonin domain-containing protein [Usitatibacter sp.]